MLYCIVDEWGRGRQVEVCIDYSQIGEGSAMLSALIFNPAMHAAAAAALVLVMPTTVTVICPGA